MANESPYQEQVKESGSYRSAMEKVLIRSFYDSPADLHDFLFLIYYAFEPVERFRDKLPEDLYDLYVEKVGLHKRRIAAIAEIAGANDGDHVLDLACDLGAVSHYLT